MDQEHIGSTPLAATSRSQASFSRGNQLARVAWGLCWLVLARPTPPALHGWRRLLLRLFGAQIAPGARVYSSARVWLPRNLSMGAGSVLGRRVNCYNQGRIAIGERVVVSQDASLCASTHDVNDPLFPLLVRPIAIGDDAWVAAEAFVGPGVTIGDGAVLGARGVAMRDLPAWVIHSGNPARPLRPRRPPDGVPRPSAAAP